MTTSILIVEDHDANRMILRRRLERLGFKIDEASDGLLGVAAFKASPADMILMDLSMPNMSGFEALTEIRKLPRGDTTPVIALTAHAMDSVRDQCTEQGFDAFLSKPLEFDALVEVIRKLSPDLKAAS